MTLQSELINEQKVAHEKISKRKIDQMEKDIANFKIEVSDLESKNRLENKLIKDNFESEKEIMIS